MAATSSALMSCPTCRKRVEKENTRKVYIPHGPSNNIPRTRSAAPPLAPATTMENLLNDTIKEASEQVENLRTENTRLESALKGAFAQNNALQDAVQIATTKLRDGARRLDTETRASLEARGKEGEARAHARRLGMWVHRLVVMLCVLLLLLLFFGAVMARFAKVTSKVTGATVWQSHKRAIWETLKSLFRL
uniref:Uncharacterized protein n=1 Tax=Psilocybe cubensis TaxID=181762 RepID=A0A8H7XQY5_PSICU